MEAGIDYSYSVQAQGRDHLSRPSPPVTMSVGGSFCGDGTTDGDAGEVRGPSVLLSSPAAPL